MTVTVGVPHAGADTHTLVVAVEIDDRMLGRPDLHQQLLDRIAPLVADALAPHTADRQTALALCHDLEVPADRIFSGRADRGTAHARQELCRRLHDDHGWTLHRIGRCIGRDHTTVLDGVRQARKRLVCDTDGCDQPSLAGGRWCHPCFTQQTLVRRRAERLRLAVPA